MNWARHAAGLSDRPDRFPTKATCLAIYSRVVNSQAPLAETLGKHFPWAAAHEEALRGLFAGYVEAKQRQSVLDYDDLLLYFAKALAEPEIAAEIASRFDHLLVDEYQDTNRLQAEIALSLRPRGRGLTVVGDDAQSIYSFRAATVRNILDFPKVFDPPARVVTLDRNYRSTQPILAASNAVIGLSPERWAKDLWTDRGAGAIPAAGHDRRGGGSGALRRVPRAGKPRGGRDAEIAGGAVPRRASQRRARTGADTAQRAVRQIRRAEISRRGAYQGCSRRSALRQIRAIA